MTTRLFSEALSDNEFKQQIFAEKAAGETVIVNLGLSNKFDPWDIEEYFANLVELPIDELYIDVLTQYKVKPDYQACKELVGALEHFGDFIGLERRHPPNDNLIFKNYKVFKLVNGMTVYFEELSK